MNTTDRILGEAMTPRQKRIYKDPEKAVRWATKHGQRFPEAEPYVLKATDPGWSYGYAKEVLKGRWPEAEEAIVKDPHMAYLYAMDVIKGRWPEAEPTIAKDPSVAFYYAKHVIGGRFPEAEEAIVKNTSVANPHLAKSYLELFPEAKLGWLMNGWIDWLDL